MFDHITFEDKLLFTKHLATMLKAGIPIAETLDVLLKQTKSHAMQNVLTKLLGDIQNGQSLGAALKKFPRVFDELYVSLITVGEESGKLEENCAYLSEQLTKDHVLRGKIKQALMYPIFVLVATVVMGGFISIFVLPQLVDFFASFQTDLPIPTKILLGIATYMKSYGILTIAGVIGFGFVWSLFVRTAVGKPVWDGILLRLPIVGDMTTYGQLARFCRNLGALLQSGVPVTRSLEVTGQSLSNIPFHTAVLVLSKSLSKGQTIGETMDEKKLLLFPTLVSRMIKVGEKSGKLEDMLLYLGDYYEEEIDSLSKNLSTILEPVLLIFIGLVVGFTAVAIISPIYSLTGSISQ